MPAGAAVFLLTCFLLCFPVVFAVCCWVAIWLWLRRWWSCQWPSFEYWCSCSVIAWWLSFVYCVCVCGSCVRVLCSLVVFGTMTQCISISVYYSVLQSGAQSFIHCIYSEMLVRESYSGKSGNLLILAWVLSVPSHCVCKTCGGRLRGGCFGAVRCTKRCHPSLHLLS